MSEMDDDTKETRSTSPSIESDDEHASDNGGAATPTDKVNNTSDITNDNVGTHAPSPPSSSPLNDENVKNDALSNDITLENDEEEEEEYETSYAKLQKLRRNYGASDHNTTATAVATPVEDSRDEEGNTHNNESDNNFNTTTTTSPQEQQQQKRQRRRRRGGYGSSNNNNNAASLVLESLNDNEGTAGAAMADDNTNVEESFGESNDDANNNVKADSWNLDNLDMVDDQMVDRNGGDTSNLFLEEEDDDATRPYDDRSGGDGNDDNDNEEEKEMEMEEYEDAPTTGRGRTKKQNKVIQQREDVDPSDEVEEENEPSSQPEEHEPSNGEGEVDASTTTQAANPTNKEVIALVDKLFQAADKDNMTVGTILSYVAEHFGFKDKKALGKERKHMIKERLTLLISGKVDIDNDSGDDEKKAKKKKKAKKAKKKKKETVEEEETVEYSEEDDLEVEDDEDIGGNDSSSDYEEEAPSKKKRTSRKARKKKSTLAVDDDEDSDHSDYSDSSLTNKRSSSSKRKTRRSKGSSKKGKMKNHLRDEATKRRRRQMEEARIRQEEMGHLADDHNDEAVDGAVDSKSKVKSEEQKANAGPQISEQDRQRAMAIAARFDTNREELRVKREEDRVGLIGKLRQRRLESITSNELSKETKEVDVMGVEEDKGDEKKADVKDEGLPLADPAQENNEGGGMIDLDDDSDSDGDSDGDSDDDSDDDDDELEIVAQTPKAPMKVAAAKPKPKSVFDSLLSNHGKDAVRRPIVVQKKTKPAVSNPRMALRMALREKQVKAGNRWLAR